MLPQGSEIVVATRNVGKVKELASMFLEKGLVVKSLRDFSDMPDIVEDGVTFADNALIKARTIAQLLGIPVVADDSGLCVDRLNGEPGVFSARYAGEHATDEQNNRKLLEELTKLEGLPEQPSDSLSKPNSLSAAQFVCSICLVDSAGNPIVQVEASCDGEIIAEARGDNGFGYDPLFYIPDFDRTMAELELEQKNTISHRGSAIRMLWKAIEV
ncbi:XTP/dITP diphosphatase [Paenibacillus sp. LMG 31456]|uniref:dITP/XTP pyrophosphatase n=1 Tax=Paenibacillus foliorum TaxID=2654974 RepID=A0A972K0T5_9BACL|nr:XTP/dITP diphosphatase [Paenibacillus foliorum]NOU95979.1 XTP/dITP diphosphatase [Paenibacillus foliorum]